MSRYAGLPEQLLAATRENDLLRLHTLLLNNPELVNADLGTKQRTALNTAVELGNDSVLVLLLAQCVHAACACLRRAAR